MSNRTGSTEIRHPATVRGRRKAEPGWSAVAVSQLRHLNLLRGEVLAIALPLAITAVYLVLALHEVTLPGFYGDETSELTPLLPVVGHYDLPYRLAELPETDIYINGAPFPLMVHPFVGALKAMLLLPVTAIFGISVGTVRTFLILVAALGVFMTYQFTRMAFSRTAAAVTALLLALDQTYIMWTRVDSGPNALPIALKMTACAALLAWWRTSKRSLLAIGGLTLGMGLYNKADFAWVLFSLGAATAVVFWREVRPLITRANVLTFLASFCLGCSILIWYNVRWPLASFQQPNPEHIVWWHLDVLWANLQERLSLLTLLLDGRSFDRAFGLLPGSVRPFSFGTLGWHVFLGCLVLAGMFAAVRRPAWDRMSRAMRWLLLSMGLFFACLVVAVAAYGPIHVLNIYPFPQVLMGAILTDGLVVIGRLLRPRLRFVLGALSVMVVSILLVCNAILIGNTFNTLDATGGTGPWSDAIYTLSRQIGARPAGTTTHMMDWTLFERVALLLDGRMEGVDSPWLLLLDGPQAAMPYVRALLSNPNAEYVVTEPGAQAFPQAWNNMLIDAAKLGWQFHTITTLYQRDGIPNLQVGKFVHTRGAGGVKVVIASRGLYNIILRPAPPPRGASGNAGLAVEWDAGNDPNAELYASVDGGPEVLFAGGSPGSEVASWVQPGHEYVFRLYFGSEHSGNPLTARWP